MSCTLFNIFLSDVVVGILHAEKYYSLLSISINDMVPMKICTLSRLVLNIALHSLLCVERME